MEKFDLIDRSDNVIGTTDKVEAHSKKLPHRIATVYVFNSIGQLFMQVHKASGGLLDHSVGGHVSKGEDYAVAASREADEELGIKQPLDFLTTLWSDEGIYFHMHGIFECVADESWEFVPNEEVEEIIPKSLEAIWGMMKEDPAKFTPGFLNTMNEYRRLKGM